MTDTEILDELQKAVARSDSNKWDLSFGSVWLTLDRGSNLRTTLEAAIRDSYARRVAKELAPDSR